MIELTESMDPTESTEAARSVANPVLWIGSIVSVGSVDSVG